MEKLIERLEKLKEDEVIGGWVEPHPNLGLSGGTLPWVVMPATFGPASTFYSEAELDTALSVLEVFGPMQLSKVFKDRAKVYI